MLKDDWLMRIIKQSARMMGNILKNIQEGSLDNAQQQIDEALDEYVGIDSRTAEYMSAPEMIARLGIGEMAGAGKLIFLTDLLHAEAVICDAEDDETGAYNRRIKALDIRLTLAIGREMSSADFDATIDQLINELDEYELPTMLLEKLFSYYEKSQQYRLAIDTLNYLIDGDHYSSTNMVDDGLAFYERLLRLHDVELRIGSVTHQEVQAQFNKLWKRASP